MATTAMRLVHASDQTQGRPRSSADPGLGVTTPLALVGHEPEGMKHSPCSVVIPTCLSAITPGLLRVFASSRETSAHPGLPRLSPRWGWSKSLIIGGESHRLRLDRPTGFARQHLAQLTGIEFHRVRLHAARTLRCRHERVPRRFLQPQ